MLIHPFSSIWPVVLSLCTGVGGRWVGGGGGEGVGEADETATQSKVGCNYSLNKIIIQHSNQVYV